MSATWHPLSAVFVPDPPVLATRGVLEIVLRGARPAEILYAGDRMHPAVRHGARVRLERRAAAEVRVGEVILTAAGAIDERGKIYVAGHAAEAGADDAWLNREALLQAKTIRAQRAAYTPHRPALDPRDRTVIVVDDGLATGMTMTAALRAVRARGPAWLVCAVAVASPRGLERAHAYADDVVCLAAPEDFTGVSLFYDEFASVADAEVVRLLRSR